MRHRDLFGDVESESESRVILAHWITFYGAVKIGGDPELN